MTKALPAKVKRTGMRQLSISLGEAHAEELERMRVESGLRSWGQVVRMLIADAMVRRHKGADPQGVYILGDRGVRVVLNNDGSPCLTADGRKVAVRNVTTNRLSYVPHQRLKTPIVVPAEPQK